MVKVGFLSDGKRETISVLEALGADSLWTPGHISMGRPVAESIVGLTHLAAITQRVEIGTAVLIMPLYHPVILAKQLVEIDRMTEGRVTLGIGVGGEYPQEFSALQMPLAERGARDRPPEGRRDHRRRPGGRRRPLSDAARPRRGCRHTRAGARQAAAVRRRRRRTPHPRADRARSGELVAHGRTTPLVLVAGNDVERRRLQRVRRWVSERAPSRPSRGTRRAACSWRSCPSPNGASRRAARAVRASSGS